jgi:hypothetical protein
MTSRTRQFTARARAWARALLHRRPLLRGCMDNSLNLKYLVSLNRLLVKCSWWRFIIPALDYHVVTQVPEQARTISNIVAGASPTLLDFPLHHRHSALPPSHQTAETSHSLIQTAATMTRTPSTRLPTIKLGPRLTARDAWIGQHVSLSPPTHKSILTQLTQASSPAKSGPSLRPAIPQASHCAEP